MADLKPCPFCGGNDVALVDSEKLIGKFVVCNDCCVDGPMREKPADAIAAWNRRAPLAPLTEAEVEAAATAMWDMRHRQAWVDRSDGVKALYRSDARAALAAFVAGRTGG